MINLGWELVTSDIRYFDFIGGNNIAENTFAEFLFKKKQEDVKHKFKADAQ